MSTTQNPAGASHVHEPTAELPNPADDLRAETARLFDECRKWVRRFVVMNANQAVILAAWILHTWAIHFAETTPYIHVTSAELGSGKTRLLLVLRAVVREPRFTDNMSPAALARIVSTVRPTLLIDELDAVLQADKERAQDLRGILNGGFESSGTYTRCVGKDFKVEHFSTFCPKVLSGIGELWPTVASRAIRLGLKRKLATESVEPFRIRRVNADAEPLRKDLEVWADHVGEQLKNLEEPVDIPGLTDRQADIVEPLLQIATLAGEQYLKLLAGALESVLAGSGDEHGQSLGVSLLGDCRLIFNEEKTDRLPSAHLAELLCKVEGRPWAEWNHGRGMTANQLARQLAKYNIAPGTIRTVNGTIKGYKRSDFEDYWNRLCPSTPLQTVTPSQPASTLDKTAFSNRHTRSKVTVEKSPKPAPIADCDGVTVQRREDIGRPILGSEYKEGRI